MRKTIAQGQSADQTHQRDGWDRTDLSFSIGMPMSLFVQKVTSSLHGERGKTGELDDDGDDDDNNNNSSSSY